MGVDFNGYTHLHKVQATLDDDDEPAEGTVILYHFPGFEDRAPEFENGATYAYTDYIEGPSLSYGGYNRWRNNLAILAGWPEHKDYARDAGQSHAASAWEASGGMLYELIHFADNEGMLGTASCIKIARELKQLGPKADQICDDWFKDVFKEMLTLFEAVTDGGAVVLS